jgi:uncharacterized protein involved in response to NO
MSQMKATPYRGPVILSLGFRPFFLLAVLSGAVILPLWIAVFRGHVHLDGPFDPVSWHVHEMLFGYAAAALTGFLFTAIPNWTGRLPVRGLPLGLLALLWLLGRFAVAGAFGLPALAVLVVDSAFLAVVLVSIVTEIIAGRNWRNLKVAVPVGLLLAANLVFHMESLQGGAPDVGIRLGLALYLFLITLIGGRIIPSFTRNWLAKRGPGPLPATFNGFDKLCLASTALALLLWTGVPGVCGTAAVLALSGLLNLVRLIRWRGERTMASPLLIMLHLAYLFIPFGFMTLASGQETAALHLLGIGAVAGMTVAVMIRATLGHSGLPLECGRLLTLAFSLILGSALLRSLAAGESLFGFSGLMLAAWLWSVGFLLLTLRLGPILIGRGKA